MNSIFSGLEALPLTPQAFHPFGSAFPLDTEGSSAPLVAYERRHTELDLPRLTTTKLAPSVLPLRINRMEYHPHSSQTFIPIHCARYLVTVAPWTADGGPDINQMKCFYGTNSIGVHYAAGVWHASMVALDEPAFFAVQMWRSEKIENDVFADLAVEVICSRLHG